MSSEALPSHEEELEEVTVSGTLPTLERHAGAGADFFDGVCKCTRAWRSTDTDMGAYRFRVDVPDFPAFWAEFVLTRELVTDADGGTLTLEIRGRMSAEPHTVWAVIAPDGGVALIETRESDADAHLAFVEFAISHEAWSQLTCDLRFPRTGTDSKVGRKHADGTLVR